MAFLTDIMAEFNWTDLFYGLIPVAYLVAQFFGSNEEKKKGKSPEERKRAADDEAARAERRRRIQEEIRRRLTGEEAPQPVEETARHELAPEETFAPVPERPRSADPDFIRPEAAQPTRGPDGYSSDIERQLARQKEALAKARSERHAARKRAADITRDALGSEDSRTYGESPATGALRGEVLQNLRSARDIRAALVLAEVLAPPVSERETIAGRLF